MASDSDACLPQALTDFVFDLFDSVTTSQIHEEQLKLYRTTFRELSSKYYATSPWPSPQSIASECNGNPLFLAIYREVTHRHWHSVSRPTVRDRIEGWHVYRELFDEILLDAEEASKNDKQPNFYILPEWTFDILHEFVYQFQGFCQFRTSLHASATRHGVTLPSSAGGEATSASGSAPHHVTDSLAAVSQNRDAWAAETVLLYLHKLVAVGTSPKCTVPAYQYLGLFASVTLSRLECLLGDYNTCLSALSPISSPMSVTVEDETMSGHDVVKSVFSARLSLAYHAGVSFLMLRRYKDALRILGDICAYMQRGFKTGQLRKQPNSEQFGKLYDRMIALLAILTHVCPPTGIVEESVLRTIREKHGSQLSKIDAGEEGYEDLFMFACPKFISPALPDYSQPNTNSHDAYKLQVRRFVSEMSTQHASRKLRSYMKLYTSIGVTKLAAFNDTTEEEFLPLLMSYKHKMRQLEHVGGDEVPLIEGKIRSALDIHYYIVNEMVHVDEAEKQRRFENFFMTQIAQNSDIMKEVETVSIQ